MPATEAIVERVRRLPGVRAAAAATNMPYNGINTDGFLVEGREPPPSAGAETQVVQSAVTPGYFGVLAIPLRSAVTSHRVIATAVCRW